MQVVFPALFPSDVPQIQVYTHSIRQSHNATERHLSEANNAHAHALH